MYAALCCVSRLETSTRTDESMQSLSSQRSHTSLSFFPCKRALPGHARSPSYVDSATHTQQHSRQPSSSRSADAISSCRSRGNHIRRRYFFGVLTARRKKNNKIRRNAKSSTHNSTTHNMKYFVLSYWYISRWHVHTSCCSDSKYSSVD